MKHEFKEIVDRRLSHITWTEAQSREVLRLISEEERPVKKMRLGVVVVVAVLCLSLATALAAGLVFNPRVEAVRLAEQTLEAKYGVTSEMLTHFSRSVETVDGGYKAVYTGAGALEGVLGAYTVEVKDGAAEATWSHDGADTSGGLDALAWGSEQLAEMLACIRKTATERFIMTRRKPSRSLRRRLTQRRLSMPSRLAWQRRASCPRL